MSALSAEPNASSEGSGRLCASCSIYPTTGTSCGAYMHRVPCSLVSIPFIAHSRPWPKLHPEMIVPRTLILAAFAAGLVVSPALAEKGRGPDRVSQRDALSTRDQDRAFRDTREGLSMPLPSIERRVLPLVPHDDYLGPEFNGTNYRLKFMREGRVIWVDVDAATGTIIRRSRP